MSRDEPRRAEGIGTVFVHGGLAEELLDRELPHSPSAPARPLDSLEALDELNARWLNATGGHRELPRPGEESYHCYLGHLGHLSATSWLDLGYRSAVARLHLADLSAISCLSLGRLSARRDACVGRGRGARAVGPRRLRV